MRRSSPHRHPAAIILYIALILAGTLLTSTPASASPADAFSALSSAPTHTDLPLGNESSGLAGGKLRSIPTYPQLRLDAREPRETQKAHVPVTHPVESDKALSDFQRLARQTFGQTLPIYGHDLFGHSSASFEPIDQVNVPADYVIGPGDEIYLRAWGSVDIDYRATVDRRGAITIPKVGEISLAGVRFGQLRKHLRGSIARSYHGFELSVSMGQLRSIRIYITGFANSPGTYTINALSTPINALSIAGGPAVAGDLRHVEIHRAGRLLATLDFYQFIQKGTHDNSLRLMPEDVIHIPALQAEAAIAGSVHRSGIYRLKNGENLADLIRYAGGVSATASTHRVVIERISEAGERTVEEYTLNDDGKLTDIRNGDVVLIQPISPRFVNAVTLRGHVAQPLRHAWRPGLRVSDLLPSSEALISPQYWVSKHSKTTVVSLLDGGPETSMNTDFPDINWEYAVIERVDPATMTTELLPFHLHGAVIDRNPDDDQVLQPGDKITVFALKDFRTRTAQKPHFVQLEGEVGRAGFYEVAPNETLAELITRAGGLTEHAYLFGLELKRESVRQQQKLRIGESIDQLEQEYQRHLIDRSRNVLSGDMSLAISPEAAAIQRLITRLREAEPSGRIVLELNAGVSLPHQLPALSLTDGDRIHVPSRPATIEVVGAVFRQGSFIYDETSSKHYIANAGLLPTADSRRIYVIRPDGSFSPAGRKLKLKPGDTLIVPEKVDRQRLVRRVKDWTQVLYQFGLGAAGLNLLEVF